MKNVTITLTRNQAKELTTVISHLVGCLQDRATKAHSGLLDEDWAFWHCIEKACATSLGFDAYCDPTSDLAQSILNQLEPEKRTPDEWQNILGITVLDPDGWDRKNFAVDWAKPLTQAEFQAKADMSTTTGRRNRL